MDIHLNNSVGDVGIRLLLFLMVLMLPLIAYVANHVNSDSFISLDIPEHQHSCSSGHPDTAASHDAELQEDEFDEAVIPKTFHGFTRICDLPKLFCFEQPAGRQRSVILPLPSGYTRVLIPDNRILRC